MELHEALAARWRSDACLQIMYVVDGDPASADPASILIADMLGEEILVVEAR